MSFIKLKEELRPFYSKLDYDVYDFNERCCKKMNDIIPDNISSYKQKGMQYEIIAKMCDPVLFHNSSFYFETATMAAACTGEGDWGKSKIAPTHPGGWTYRKNKHLFKDQNEELYENSHIDGLYAWCGDYGDFRWHFAFDIRPVLKYGLNDVYEKVQKTMQGANGEELEFLEGISKGLLCIREISEKFAQKAEKMLLETSDAGEIKRLERIKDSARYTPWNAPRNFYEAINCIMFIYKVIGTLEGVSIGTLGRLDVLLYPFYKQDILNKTFTIDEITEFIDEFTFTWNLQADHDLKREHFHPDPTTYTLGGCDETGEALCNELTLLFLESNYKQKLIMPTIKCRFSSKSPKKLLQYMNKDVLRGRSNILYQNDDAFIPALQKAGVSEKDSYDYCLLGCWEPVINGATNEHCGYVNLIKIMELSVWGDFNHPELKIISLDNAKTFDEVYDITIKNIASVFAYKCDAAVKGREIWNKVDPLMLISSTMEDCVKKKKDYTNGGAKYQFDELICTGITNVVDSLLVIKELCFEKNTCTLAELLTAVRSNWNGFETLRKKALGCSFWCDESESSCSLMRKVTDDIYESAHNLPALYDGKVVVGYMLFLEMQDWAWITRATPDGRYSGDFFERGFNPSILHRVESFTALINSMKYIDSSKIMGNSIVNVNLSLKTENADILDAYLYTLTDTAIQAMMINCVTKEELEDAIKNPEKYRDLVVRVCGYSAKFITLPSKIQNEFLLRNYM